MSNITEEYKGEISHESPVILNLAAPFPVGETKTPLQPGREARLQTFERFFWNFFGIFQIFKDFSGQTMIKKYLA